MSDDLFARVVDGLAESVVTGPAVSQGKSATRAAIADAVTQHLRGDAALTFMQVMKHTRHAGDYADISEADVAAGYWAAGEGPTDGLIAFVALCGDVADRVEWWLSPRPVM